ncbi:gliding motility-associated C-terminal domain-containing protein [Chryseobacterium tongliaoense]|uniref:gliding motility-associated C-terminal domain-containing protein n=1 Tax=Chryseobacterium tongliaoense TaxID=3240933 RepID=UPI003510DE73
MKKLLLSFCTFLCLLMNAQLDTDHWFAPMAAKANVTGLEGYLYLSTDQTTPFPVEIYNNNTLFTTVQVSKGNPAQVIIPNNFLITTNQSDLFTPNTMGMHVKGPKKFFANYRFSLQNHAEIITSKGLAGLGTTFFAGVIPNTADADYVNSTIGVTATEDNTTVVISGYDPNVIFSDGVSSPTRTFTLNKGQSYLLDVISFSSQANLAGLVGAKIVATKPISVTNGNFNGIYTNFNFTNNDVLMDQAVPVDRLGKDFVVVKGNGSVTSGMETALIIATENNTQLTINGTATGITLNEGQHYMVPSNKYINQGNGHYNMSISATKNIYVYQLLAGVSSGNEYPTGGMNFIPPLSCFMPNKIDEIGFRNKIGNQTFNTRLNIITQTGATVTFNGAPIAAGNGPYPVTGNPAWVSYSIPNIGNGNITINSTKSVTAGIAAGSGAAGYGGYFAGFSSVPVITKTGDCYSGILLQVDSNYDAYQWYLNGNPISGATTYSINPELYGAGDYTCLITKNNCESKLTAVYNYTLCPPMPTITYNIGSCNTKVITPLFTTSNQSIVSSHTQIVSQPASGTAVVDAVTGQIIYTPNPGLTADTADSFIYYIEGNGNPADFEYIKIVLNIDVLQATGATLNQCGNTNGANFDLTTAAVSTDPGATVSGYYLDQALTSAITNSTSYPAPTGTTTVYVKVTSAYGCSKTVPITLIVNESPNLNTANYNATLCDDNFDGIINVNFNTITPQIVNNANNFTVRYYLNLADATAGNNNTLPSNWTYTTDTVVYVRVDGNNSCPPASGQINFKIGNKVTLLSNTVNVEVCDNDLNGSENVNLNDYKNLFTTDPTVTVSFYNSLANAQSGTNAISPIQIINNPVVFFVRFESINACPTTGTLSIALKSPKKSDFLKDQVICSDDQALLDAGPGFTSYAWSTGATTQTITVGAGNYYVDLGFNGCIYRQSVNVTTAQAPTITRIEVSGANATVFVTGGTPPYQYSLNGMDYQSSNIFTGLERGVHKVYVLGADGCQPVVKEFLVLNLVNAITPNGDGINDVLNYSDLRIKQDVSIEIVDRYGAAVYRSKDQTYTWDGKSGSRPLPTGTYWYIIKWTEPDTKLPVSYSGWILIKNRE